MNIKKLLYESFDRNLTESERQKLDGALDSSNNLNKEKDEIFSLREMVFSNTQKDFSAGFEFEIIRRLNSSSTKGNYQYVFFNSLNTVFRRLAYATIIFIILTLSYNFGKSGNISFQSAIGIKQQNTSLVDDFTNLFSFYD
jgi:hypothetical protein